MKKLVASLLIVLLLVTTFGTAVSAATMNDVLNELLAANVPQIYVTQAESYLATRTDITPAQYDQIIQLIRDSYAIIQNYLSTHNVTLDAASAAQVTALSATQPTSGIVLLGTAAPASDSNFVTVAATQMTLAEVIHALSSAEKVTILNNISKAASIIGLTATWTGKDDVIAVRDLSGKLVFAQSHQTAVKQTGFDYSLALAGLTLIVLAGVVALATRRRQQLSR